MYLVIVKTQDLNVLKLFNNVDKKILSGIIVQKKYLKLRAVQDSFLSHKANTMQVYLTTSSAH